MQSTLARMTRIKMWSSLDFTTLQLMEDDLNDWLAGINSYSGLNSERQLLQLHTVMGEVNYSGGTIDGAIIVTVVYTEG